MSTATTMPTLVTAADWYAGGTRVPYATPGTLGKKESAPREFLVFERVATGSNTATGWTTFLPGFPDGSYGYSRLDALLGSDVVPRLFVEYVGQGDSDKPRDYPYGTRERADLVEARWRAHGITETAVVTFDYSSLVLMELLARQQERAGSANVTGTRIASVLIVNGGLFVDAHSHPLVSTPLLKSPLGRMSTTGVQRSPAVFAQVMKTAKLFSRGYKVGKAELREEYDAVTRRDGAAFLHLAAGFVDEHKANAERWDLARLHTALHDSVRFHVAGSTEDPYEHKQIDAARERLGPAGLTVTTYPGGHMTTSEHPDLLAADIRALAAELPPAGRRQPEPTGS